MRPLSMIIATLLSLHAFCTLSAPSASKGGLTLVFTYLYSHLALRKLTAKRFRSSLGSACSTRSTRAFARMRKVHDISALPGRSVIGLTSAQIGGYGTASTNAHLK